MSTNFLFFFHQMNGIKKFFFLFHLRLFLFSRYSGFWIYLFHFFPCQSLLEKMIENKSWSLWHHQLAKQEYNKNTYCMISWEGGMTLKLGQLIKYWIRSIIWKKQYSESGDQKLVPNPFLIFKTAQNSQCMQKVFWK